jgi:hypothetical protein
VRIRVYARCCALWFISAAMIACIGCSGDSSVGTLQGLVTLDGKPLDSAQMRFSPIDGQSATSGCSVTNGKYELQLPVAKHRVEISATRMPPGGKAAEKHTSVDFAIVQLVPSKYNSKSDLTIEVKAGRNAHNFDLKSQ